MYLTKPISLVEPAADLSNIGGTAAYITND